MASFFGTQCINIVVVIIIIIIIIIRHCSAYSEIWISETMTSHAAGLWFFAKWRHGRHLESMTSYPKTNSVIRCVFTRGTIKQTHPDPIRNDESLSPVHTGDYSRRIWRQSPNSATVAENGDCRRIWQQSPLPNSATVAVSGDYIAEIGDYSFQCGQGVRLFGSGRPNKNTMYVRPLYFTLGHYRPLLTQYDWILETYFAKDGS